MRHFTIRRTLLVLGTIAILATASFRIEFVAKEPSNEPEMEHAAVPEVTKMTEEDIFVFDKGIWTDQTTGKEIPAGTIVQGTDGMFRLDVDARTGFGSVVRIAGTGSSGGGRYVVFTQGGNAISTSIFSFAEMIEAMKNFIVMMEPDDVFVFSDGVWINEGTGMPLSPGTLVQGTSGLFRLEKKEDEGQVILISGGGATGYGKHIRFSHGGNAIAAGQAPPKEEAVQSLSPQREPETGVNVQTPAESTNTVNISGIVRLPDGSPAVGYHISASGLGFSLDLIQTGEDGTFQIADVPNCDVIFRIIPLDADAKRFSLKPFVFVPEEGMTLNLTLEEGIPVRGRVVYENGLPAVGCRLYFRDSELIKLIEIQIENSHSTMWVTHFHTTVTDENGEYVAYLLPGEYTTDGWDGTIKIEKADTASRLDFIFPTPVFIKLELADGSPVDGHSLSSWSPIEASARRDAGNNLVKAGNLFTFEPVSRETVLYIIDREAKQGTIAKITPDMAGSEQHFTLQPMGSATVRLAKAENEPMAGKEIRLGYIHRDTSSVPHRFASWVPVQVETDLDGKVTLPVFAGKHSIFINPTNNSESERSSRGTINHIIERELDLAPGENIDLGTVRLIRVFGTSKHPTMSNIQITTMSGPDAPIAGDSRSIKLAWIVDGEYDILLPPGHYRFSGLDHILSIGEDSRDFRLDFDAEGRAVLMP